MGPVIPYLIVCPLVFLGGFVDAIAGGGGLISLPAYLIAGLPAHAAIGTNKISSAMGTTLTTVKFWKQGYIQWKLAVLCAVCALAGGYILISALVIFNVEPDSFGSFFDAIYWATVSLTTMGYGDIYPVTTIGRVVTMVSSIFGIAIIALPAGIITAGFMEQLNNEKEK